MVSRHACVEMGGRQWTVEEANSSKLVMSSVRLEDEDVNFLAAKVAVREEIRQRLQDLHHFEEDSNVLFERMQDEAEDADQLAMELGNCTHTIEFIYTLAASRKSDAPDALYMSWTMRTRQYFPLLETGSFLLMSNVKYWFTRLGPWVASLARALAVIPTWQQASHIGSGESADAGGKPNIFFKVEKEK